MLRNSYITVATSPGCTCSERCAGLKSHGPRALASNSMVTVRVCVDLRVGRHLRCDTGAAALRHRQHVDAQRIADRLVQRHQRIAEAEHQRRRRPRACAACARLSPRSSVPMVRGACGGMRSAREQPDLGHEAEREHDAPSTRGSSARRALALRCSVGVHVAARGHAVPVSRSPWWRWRRAWAASRRCATAPATAPPTPGPRPPSHGRCGAGSPLPRIIGSATAKKKYTCIRPKPNAPTDAMRVEVGELQRVVGIAARHARQAEEVHREEGEVEEDQRQPRSGSCRASRCTSRRSTSGPSSRCRRTSRTASRPPARSGSAPPRSRCPAAGWSIGAIARISPVKPPIVNTNRKPTAHSIGVSKVIEPRHMVAIQLKIFTPVGTAISIVAYMKNSWPGHRHAGGVHVVRPHDERQDRDRRGGVHHRRVAEQALAREGRDDRADDAERRQDHDVDLGVPEEPEDVLVHHRVAAAGRVEEAWCRSGGRSASS